MLGSLLHAKAIVWVFQIMQSIFVQRVQLAILQYETPLPISARLRTNFYQYEQEKSKSNPVRGGSGHTISREGKKTSQPSPTGL